MQTESKITSHPQLQKLFPPMAMEYTKAVCCFLKEVGNAAFGEVFAKCFPKKNKL